MPPRIPLEMIALGAAAAAVGLLVAQRAEAPEPPPEPGDDPYGELTSPPWPAPEYTANPAPVDLPFPGGHPEFDNQVLYGCTLNAMMDPLAPLMVKAIIRHESGWNPRALGDAGCSKGLMQVNGCAHPQLDRDRGGAYDLFEPNQNILAGCQLLKREYHLYWPDWERVLVGYNGPALAQRGIRTNAYSRAVAAHFRRFAADVGIAV